MPNNIMTIMIYTMTCSDDNGENDDNDDDSDDNEGNDDNDDNGGNNTCCPLSVIYDVDNGNYRGGGLHNFIALCRCRALPHNFYTFWVSFQKIPQ